MSTNETGTHAGNGSKKNLTERLAAVGAKPVMAMEERPAEAPMAVIVRDWLAGTNEHYRQMEDELTATWARKLLALEDQRHNYMRRMLEALTK